jgi:predicted nucleic acid-binding protein
VIVTDTNILVYLFLDSPYTDAAEQLQRREPDWIAPALWRSEFRNALALYLHQSQLLIKEAIHIQHLAESLMDDTYYDVPSTDVLWLAKSSGCSAYDCEFVVLAQRMDCPLITMDRKVVKAFPDTARLLVG